MIQFGTLHPDGTLSDVRVISQNSIMECSHVIMIPDHYRPDGSCRCDDSTHEEMSEWGYAWTGKVWEQSCMNSI